MAEAPAVKVEIAVGLVSYNNAPTIPDVAGAIRGALAGHFAGIASRVVLADCGSSDDTLALVRESLGGIGELLEVPSARTTADVLEPPYHRIPGKARALRGILTTARDIGAQACVVLDAGVETVGSPWLEQLAGPVLEHGADLVAPFYRRHRFDGALTKAVVYPMFRALYGVRLRQPAAGEFACSPRLIDHLLEQIDWDREGAQAGIDIWLATSAASGDFRVAEAALGVRRSHLRGDDTPDLGTTITQVIGALFGDLEGRVARWQRVRSSAPVQQFGDASSVTPLAAVPIDAERLIESFRLGYRELRDIWTWVLPPRTIVDLRRLMDVSVEAFRFDDVLWARIVYDFALAYHLRVLARDHLLRSFVPLYLAWFASFVLGARECAEHDVDQRIERLCAAFEAEKPYLISKWRWPERLRT